VAAVTIGEVQGLDPGALGALVGVAGIDRALRTTARTVSWIVGSIGAATDHGVAALRANMERVRRAAALQRRAISFARSTAASVERIATLLAVQVIIGSASDLRRLIGAALGRVSPVLVPPTKGWLGPESALNDWSFPIPPC
jgi:hypothetical protein